jgi:tetratricopeptide (TPR) repeat protein
MTTSTPAAGDLATLDASAVPRSRPTRRRGRALALGAYRLLVLVLVACNAWWLYRDYRPLEDLKTLRGWVDQRQFAAAEPALREHLRRSPNHDAARMLLARSLAGRGRWLACAGELHRMPFWSPRKPEARFLEGQAYMTALHAVPAEAALLACIDDTPLHPTPADYHKAATELLIELYATEERWEEAQAVVWKTYERVGSLDRPAAIIMWMRTELERIEPKTTVARLRSYVQADPTDLEARRALARAEQAVGRDAEATRQIELCLQARPDDPRIWRDWLKILRFQNSPEGMAEVVARLPESALDDPEVLEYQGMVRESAGDLDGAAISYRKAVELKPFDEDFHYRLALVESRLGHRDKAREHLDRSKVLRDAHGKLLDAFLAYRDAVATDQPGGTRLTATAAELAELCRTMGLVRIADALAANHPAPAA